MRGSEWWSDLQKEWEEAWEAAEYLGGHLQVGKRKKQRKGREVLPHLLRVAVDGYVARR